MSVKDINKDFVIRQGSKISTEIKKKAISDKKLKSTKKIVLQKTEKAVFNPFKSAISSLQQGTNFTSKFQVDSKDKEDNNNKNQQSEDLESLTQSRFQAYHASFELNTTYSEGAGRDVIVEKDEKSIDNKTEVFTQSESTLQAKPVIQLD